MNKLLAFVALIVVAGCASEPSVQSGPNAETTFDGLVRIDTASCPFVATFVNNTNRR